MVLEEKAKKGILKIAIYRFLRKIFPKKPDFLGKYEVSGKKFFGVEMNVHKRTSLKKLLKSERYRSNPNYEKIAAKLKF